MSEESNMGRLATRSLARLAAAAATLSLGLVLGTGALFSAPAAAHPAASCQLTSLPSFMDQGELAHASSIADVITLSCESGTFAGKAAFIGSLQLNNRCKHTLRWTSVDEATPGPAGEPGIKVRLDASGNATVVVWGGPSCSVGENLIEAHTEEAPIESVATAFTVLAPAPTPEGINALPQDVVESANSGAAATIVQVEYAGTAAASPVTISAGGLVNACGPFFKTRWFGAAGEQLAEGTESVSGVELDNDGNAFVVVFGLPSCLPGTYLLQSSLEAPPFTTFLGNFTVEAPPVRSATTLTYQGPLSVDRGEPFVASAKLQVPPGVISPAGRPVTFRLGPNSGEECTAKVSGSGLAECELTPTQPNGSHELLVSFSGGPELAPASTTAEVTVKPDGTALTYTGARKAGQKELFTASARLEDPTGGAPIAGRTISFVLGPPAKKHVVCTAITNGSGVAACNMKATLTPGTYPLTATFAGDGEWEAATAESQFAILPETSLCYVESLPTFVDQGEFAQASSVADIVQVHCAGVYAEQHIELRAQQLFNRCAKHLSWSAVYAPTTFHEGVSFKVELDDAGNATAILWGGPSCAAGESAITAHLLAPPYTSVATTFTVLAPTPTPEGLYALPSTAIEDATTSSVATIVQLEFPPVDAERWVRVASEQMYQRCQVPPDLVWIGPEEQILRSGAGEGELRPDEARVQLDNDGNAFVVLVGSQSCAAGTSLIEADLENAPFTTFATSFVTEAPHSPLQ
ncbi:MAG TPA: hypothetical protein VKG82_06915 [Solirubrobacteraceae bacterium]|nr:hypothetical protein [Solirubrobacteraceae bacterium]